MAIFRSLSRGVVLYIKFSALLLVLRSLLLNEEEEEGGEDIGDYGGAARKPPKPVELRGKRHGQYVDAIDDSILRHSLLARRLRRIYLWSVSSSILAASAVPVVVAAGWPGWITALLGAIAAATQGIQQVRGDSQLSTSHHLAARRLTNARRKFLVDLSETDESTAFKLFVERAEASAESDDTIFQNQLASLGRAHAENKSALPESQSRA